MACDVEAMVTRWCRGSRERGCDMMVMHRHNSGDAALYGEAQGTVIGDAAWCRERRCWLARQCRSCSNGAAVKQHVKRGSLDETVTLKL